MLRFWCNILHINDCAVFVAIVICLSLFFTSDQCNWPNAHAFDELRTHLVTVGMIDQMRSAFGQTRSAIGQTRARFTNRCAFGQMPRV